MAHILLIASGLVHGPVEELQGQTPLAVAKAPHLTALAARGVVGRVRLIPEDLESIVEVGCLSALGYDPAKYYTGRGPLEAAAFGVALRPGEVAFRCHLVTEHDGRLVDEQAGGVTTQEAAVLLEALNTRLGGEGVQFHVGAGHRHIMVVRDTAVASSCLALRVPAPRAVLNKVWTRALPRAAGGTWLAGLLQQAREALSVHDVNQVRLDLHENPANAVWCWGQGPATALPSFQETAGRTAGLVSGSRAVEGIARLTGIEVLAPYGSLGAGEDAYHEMARALLRGLKRHSLVIACVPLIEEGRVTPRLRSRISAIELFDRALLGPLLAASSAQPATWLIVPACGPETGGGGFTFLPFAAAGPGIESRQVARFDEAVGGRSDLRMDAGNELLRWWLACGN